MHLSHDAPGAVDILGYSPCLFSNLHDKFRQVVIVTGRNTEHDEKKNFRKLKKKKKENTKNSTDFYLKNFNFGCLAKTEKFAQDFC